ncbi:MAG: NAD-dependent deacylase [Chloracidobacterium sp.]|uniref:protein acetyllysine N-acetyltransferase n=1 Tax=Chloracidobacterium validum TaxID=2821543 RepID=A0ABX8B9L5_9BACT|nr:NAD-dependent deacylase [Chloracidobacterium validum]QUW03361.1 NAD-dependent deacylase [Chloracidobacterium validum]
MTDDQLKLARRYLAQAKRVVIFTGAGISAESGVPTFRGSDATWKGMPAAVASSLGLLEQDLTTAWEWFDYRRTLLKAVSPNAAHVAVAQAESCFAEFLVVTQNVDGLHQKAGSKHIIELHGNIWRGRGLRTGKRYDLPETPLPTLPPRGDADEPIRPDVVLFGEMLPAGAFEEAELAAMRCDACLVIGTSGVVYPAALIPLAARDAGAAVIEVNPEATDLTPHVTLSLRGRAGDIVPQLFEA